MWFISYIVQLLVNIYGFFIQAYSEVSGWVFPFYYLAPPLLYIANAFYSMSFYFDQLNSWISLANDRISQILGAADIYSYFQYWFDAAANAWSWVSNYVNNVWSVINTWWASTQNTVVAMVQDAKTYAYNLVSSISSVMWGLKAEWDGFKVLIPSFDGMASWFNNWWGNVTTAITSWWAGAINDVQELINSAFLAREQLWDGWQAWRDRIVEFITDPLEWLNSRFEDWFWEDR